MNEEQLIEFINWLPTAVPEFKDANPDQIVETLNKMYESEEGQAALTQLFTAFQESKSESQSQMFKKGGKMDAFVNKYGKKGCCKGISKKQSGGKTLSIQPEIKPSGVKGFLWNPTFRPRVDDSGYEGDSYWEGERATYYKPNGDLIQILTKRYEAGNGAKTERRIRNPFTPISDTLTTVINQYGSQKVDNNKFNKIFSLNFDKQK